MSGWRASHTIRGVTDFNKAVGNLKKNMLSGQIKAVQDSVFLIHSLAVQSIQDNASGTPTVRYTNGRSRNVLASNPGDAPNTDTGRLVQSIKFDFKNGGLIGRVGTNLRYGAHLEFGTKDKRLLARPWLSTAVEKASKDIAEIFARALRSAAKESSK